jgi:hypothetical protein
MQKVSFQGPKEFSDMGNVKKSMGGWKNVPVSTVRLSILGNGIF